MWYLLPCYQTIPVGRTQRLREVVPFSYIFPKIKYKKKTLKGWGDDSFCEVLVCKHELLGLFPQNSYRKPMGACIRKPRDRGGSLGLNKQLSSWNSEVQTLQRSWLINKMRTNEEVIWHLTSMCVHTLVSVILHTS